MIIGTAAGDLGRHTELKWQGEEWGYWPVITNRTTVLLKVHIAEIQKTFNADIFGIGHLRSTANSNIDFWPHKILGVDVLQTVK